MTDKIYFDRSTLTSKDYAAIGYKGQKCCSTNFIPEFKNNPIKYAWELFNYLDDGIKFNICYNKKTNMYSVSFYIKY